MWTSQPSYMHTHILIPVVQWPMQDRGLKVAGGGTLYATLYLREGSRLLPGTVLGWKLKPRGSSFKWAKTCPKCQANGEFNKEGNKASRGGCALAQRSLPSITSSHLWHSYLTWTCSCDPVTLFFPSVFHWTFSLFLLFAVISFSVRAALRVKGCCLWHKCTYTQALSVCKRLQWEAEG